MLEMRTVAAALGIGLALTILYLIRRDRIHLREGFFWFAVAALSILLGSWPRLIDRIAAAVGIAYPPALLFLLTIIVLLLRLLLTDMALARTRRDLRRLNQRLALYETGARDRRDDGN